MVTVLIEVGAEAPGFSLKSDTGEDFRLSDLRGYVRPMLVFYPRDFTPGCTDQLIQVRKHIEHLRGVGIEPMGVNSGDADSHQRFRKEHAFNFSLLVDEGNGVARSYGAVKDDGSGIQRSVVVVGKNGRVIFAENGAPPWQRILSAMRTTDDVPAVT